MAGRSLSTRATLGSRPTDRKLAVNHLLETTPKSPLAQALPRAETRDTQPEGQKCYLVPFTPPAQQAAHRGLALDRSPRAASEEAGTHHQAGRRPTCSRPPKRPMTFTNPPALQPEGCQPGSLMSSTWGASDEARFDFGGAPVIGEPRRAR
jgi:hypothetical protein